MKKAIRIIPLLYFVFLSIFWFTENYMTTGTINYIALVVGFLMVCQLFINRRVVGLVTGVAMALFCIYMLLAVVADVAKPGGLTPNMIKFIAIGGGLFGTALIMALLLVYYHAKQKDTANAVSATSF